MSIPFRQDMAGNICWSFMEPSQCGDVYLTLQVEINQGKTIAPMNWYYDREHRHAFALQSAGEGFKILRTVPRAMSYLLKGGRR